MFTADSGNPTPTVNYNNMYGNSVTGSTTVETLTISGYSASYTTCCSSTGNYTSIYTAPAGKEIRRAYVSFNGSTYSQNDGARLLDADTGAVLRSFTSTTSGWYYLPAGVTKIRGQVWDTYTSSDNESVSITQVELFGYEPTNSHELVVSTNSGTTDARYNYWTPNIGDVPSKISETRVNSVNYTGYTGAEYPSGPVTEIGPRPYC